MINLKKYNQEHLLKYYNELTKEEKQELEKQIESIDYEKVNDVYKKSYTDEEIDMSKISYLNIVSKNNIKNKKEVNSIGEDVIRNNEYAIVIMAGGFGSRLGLNKPKGCLELNVNKKKISLFEIFINELKEANKKYNSNIGLYIMTSTTNNKDTVKFFKKHNNFGYDNVKFFIQSDYPILEVNGKIALKNKHEILFGPNGNGDVFGALGRSNLIDDMKKNGVKYVLFTTIDNVLSNMIDTLFIGETINSNYKISSKTLMKKDSNDKGWIFCKYKNKPFMLESRNITEELTNTKINNDYIYRETNITYHLISIDLVELFSKKDIRYHRAYKNNKFLNENGNKVRTSKKNSFKFEKFIFDAFSYTDDMLLYRVDETEFCPIKTIEDVKKAEDKLKNIL
jgi:UDP-N-acetylglucosamine/UDP-N-acetylgalactosamine diphosphorylase